MKQVITRIMRIATPVLLAIVLSAGLLGASAYSESSKEAEDGTPTRGDSPPTAATPLPYTGGSGNIGFYTFTNRKFKPVYVNSQVNYQIKISTSAYIIANPNAPSSTTATIKLYNCNTSSYAGSASTTVKTSTTSFSGTWANLNSSQYYAGMIEKIAYSPVNNIMYHSGLACTKGA